VSALRGFRLADVMQLTSCKELRYLKLLHMQLTEVLAASLCLTHQVREISICTLHFDSWDDERGGYKGGHRR
jgi:hypothetical protein